MFFKWRFESDPARKKRIEQAILLLYQKNIDSILSKTKILLPPPDPEKAFGAYEIGEVIYDEKPVCSFGLREKEFLRHIGLFGITGTGKSNVVFKLIDELIRHGKKVFVMDWKRQYRDYLTIRPNADVLIFGVGNKNIPIFQFNPLIPPPGIDPHQYQEHLGSIICSSFFAGEGVASLLRKAISDLYNEFGVYDGTAKKYPTFRDVLIYINNIERKGRSRDWQESTIRSLEAICHGGIGQIVNVQKPTMKMDELLSNNIFLELGDLGESQKKFIIQSLLTYMYYHAMNRGVREKFLTAIIVEEAHHILADHSKTTVKEPITDIILKEIREFGTGIIIVDQNPSLISVPALANNYVTVGMYTKHASDINALSKAMFLDENQKECLGKLETGMGIVKLAGRVFSPFLVKFPLMDIHKNAILDIEILLRMERKGFYTANGPIWASLDDSRKSQGFPAQQRISHDIPQKHDEIQQKLTVDGQENAERFDSFSGYSTPSRGDSAQLRISQGYSEKDEIEKIEGVNKNIEVCTQGQDTNSAIRHTIPDRLAVLSDILLKDIRAHPFDGISSRTKRLKVSNRKCNNAISELAAVGMIERVEIVEKAGRKVLFEIKKDNCDLQKDGGIEHRYWNHKIAQINKQNGYEVEFEKRIAGDGFVDLVIKKGKEIIAIEIETGKSHPVETIKRDLALGFSKVICVATTAHAYEIIREKILKENLLENPKVSIVLASNYNLKVCNALHTFGFSFI